MKINSQTTSDDHQLLLTVEIEADVMQSAKQKAARKIAKQVKIPGFRPGKAPYNVVEKQVGEAAIKDEAIDIMLDEVYPKLIEETGVKPYGPGTLEKIDEEANPPVYQFRVPLTPEVTLGDYDKIRIDFEEKQPSEEDIQQVFTNLREQNAILTPADRPAQEGDIVYVLLSATRQEAKDGDAELLPERSYPVVVEKADVDSKNEWPFPGFSRMLLGLKPGEDKSFEHTYADDSEFEELRGQTADFKLKVEEIKARELPELDDALAQSVGEYKDLAELRTEIVRQLTENMNRQGRDEYQDKVVTQMIGESTIKFPPQMLHHEVHHYIEDMEPDLRSRGMDMESYLGSRQMTMDDLEKEVEPVVEERLKKSLVIMEASRKENIEVPESEMQGIVQLQLAQLQQMVSAQDMRKFLNNRDNVQSLVSRTMSEEIIRRTLARLGAIAQGKGDEHRKESAAASVSTEDATASEAPAAEAVAAEASQPAAEDTGKESDNE
ncbi:MAG TPA: trigger factor [Anaerolineales bacterium]|nr:trigger factor [Anaerolineales bacterium]HRQ93015.1 trigger factor [Anaerolineales bacterium]